MEPTSTKKIEKSYYLEAWWPSHHIRLSLIEPEYKLFVADDQMASKSYWIRRFDNKGRVIKKIHINLITAYQVNIFEHEGNPLEDLNEYDNPLN